MCVSVCTYFGIVFVDVLVVGHLHETMAQVVVGEDEETGFQVTVHLLQILEEKRVTSVSGCQDGTCLRASAEGATLTLSCSKSCRRKVATVAVMPMKRLMTIRNTYAVLGTSNQKDAGYMMGVMDQLKKPET